MMTTDRFYRPVVRWRPGEQQALAFLLACDKNLLTPILEFPPEDFEVQFSLGANALDEKLAKTAKSIRSAWGCDPFFADLELISHLLIGGSVHPFIPLQRHCVTNGLALIPVTGLRRTNAYQSAVATLTASSRRLCLRLDPEDFGAASPAAEVEGLLEDLQIPSREADLLLDFGFLPELPAGPDLRGLVSSLGEWRSITIGGGSFPENVAGFEPGDRLQPRREWLLWKQVCTNGTGQASGIGFCDYTTQHPIHYPTPTAPNYSASIRYTLEDQFLVMRGLSVKQHGSEQWPGNAYLLAERPDFCGCSFCYGDFYIRKLGERVGFQAGPGNPQKWLTASINHHLTFVARQVAMLCGIAIGATPANEAGLYQSLPPDARKACVAVLKENQRMSRYPRAA